MEPPTTPTTIGQDLEKSAPKSYTSSGHEGRPVEEAASYVDIDEDQIVRKVDWKILPIMLACYILQFVDKVAINVSPHISYSRVGSRTDHEIVQQRHGHSGRSEDERKRLLLDGDLLFHLVHGL